MSAPAYPMAGSVAPVSCRCDLPLIVGGDPCVTCGVAFGYLRGNLYVCRACARAGVFRWASTCERIGHAIR